MSRALEWLPAALTRLARWWLARATRQATTPAAPAHIATVTTDPRTDLLNRFGWVCSCGEATSGWFATGLAARMEGLLHEKYPDLFCGMNPYLEGCVERVRTRLEPFGTQPYGDLRCNADRAAVIAVDALRGVLPISRSITVQPARADARRPMQSAGDRPAGQRGAGQPLRPANSPERAAGGAA